METINLEDYFYSKKMIKIGDQIREINDKEWYLVAQTGDGEIQLINLKRGNRWLDDRIKVNDFTQITKQEMELITSRLSKLNRWEIKRPRNF